MNRYTNVILTLVFAVCSLPILTGCGQSASTNSAAPGQSAATAADPSTDAIARAATDFMDAVIKGDTQRASARLTPQAMQRIISSGKQFAPPGLESATFKISAIRSPEVDKAVVLCILTDSASGPTPRNEEMCCLMKRVDNDWRVSGIGAFDQKTQQGVMSDFETGQSMPIPRDPSITGAPSGSPTGVPGAPTGTQNFPPRMAQEQANPTPR
jgi:hypothetical protein